MKIIKKNRKKGDCGVVAAYNTASWCNAPRPYKEVEKIAKSCGYNPKVGIYYFQFANLMKKMNLPAKRIKPESIFDLESRLYMGKFFVFLYTPTGDHTGHVISLFADHNGNIRIINPEMDRITWSEFASDVHANGMKSFVAYEVPCRQAVKTNDVTRTN